MVTLSPPPTSWEDDILRTAVEFMNAEVCFYKTVSTGDPNGTGGGTSSVEIIWRGKARVQHLRAPRDASTGYQASDSRSFRFQIDPEDNPPVLYSGTKARVLSGGRDEQLELYSFVVDSAVNSSHMAVRTVELTADMRPAKWAWSAPEDAPVVMTFSNGGILTLTRKGNTVKAKIDASNMDTFGSGAVPYPAARFQPLYDGQFSFLVGDKYSLSLYKNYFGATDLALGPVDLGPYADAEFEWIAGPDVI